VGRYIKYFLSFSISAVKSNNHKTLAIAISNYVSDALTFCHKCNKHEIISLVCKCVTSLTEGLLAIAKVTVTLKEINFSLCVK
jgi:hypothetical protein